MRPSYRSEKKGPPPAGPSNQATDKKESRPKLEMIGWVKSAAVGGVKTDQTGWAGLFGLGWLLYHPMVWFGLVY